MVFQSFYYIQLFSTFFLTFRFFWVQVFQGPGFSGSMFFRVPVQGLGPGFRSSPYTWVWICINLFNVGQIYIIDQKIKQLALQINLQCKSKSKIKELRRLYSVKRDLWNGVVKLRFVKTLLKSNWYNISGRTRSCC